MINPDDLTTMIQSGLPGAEVFVQDLTGGGDHYQATVISGEFAGKSLVQQHQLVYRSVNQVMANEQLHALALKTYTPEQWQSQQVDTVAHSSS
ncbi:MAG: BolA/IbaG family iron-sulfur metabolism protein [Acaryochloridaceae cyanobacterium CSU_3_4]|nr:BolA/IbaG family iron-sulfur metabolism protein [Acaryochloris sp. SU_5_25]NJN38990.1 BolA/IbaG family iron-sulfur metabolism protein [Acaryochloridaceae cyanobacterium CSU_3_4]